MKVKITILILFVLITATAFIQGPPKKLTYLKLAVPKGWPKPSANIFSRNPLTEEGFQLGRKLFYDGRLSKDGNFSCGSCHQQFAAFSTYDHPLSHGFDNKFTTRNAPALFNLAWTKALNWDGGVNHIEVQPLVPLTAHNEMAETLDSILYKLKADTTYKRLFTAAFGDATINSQRLLKALAQFTGSIQSYNSKYDKVKAGTASFTLAEQNGYNTFKAACSACHTEPLFTDNSFRNNGLSVNDRLNDKGRMTISGRPEDSLKFKVPSLRNAMRSFPYMHDGRFNSLDEVIEHYRTKLDITQPTLDPLLKKRLPIADAQRIDLLAFLFTLTDDKMLTDPRFAAPVDFKIIRYSDDK